jgi:hypothetical protein
MVFTVYVTEAVGANGARVAGVSGAAAAVVRASSGTNSAATTSGSMKLVDNKTRRFIGYPARCCVRLAADA